METEKMHSVCLFVVVVVCCHSFIYLAGDF